MRRCATPLTICLLLALTAPPAGAASKEPATVKLNRENVAMRITFNDNRTITVTDKGTKLAPGMYMVKSLMLVMKDNRGRTCQLRSAGKLNGMTGLTVAAAQEKVLDTGPPVALKVQAYAGKDERGQRIRIYFHVEGEYGECYHPGAWVGGKPPPRPVYRVKNESGKVVHTGHLTPKRGACSTDWYLPGPFKGKLTVEVRAKMGPFKWNGGTREVEFE